LGILRDPVDELLRFAFAPRIDFTVEAVHQFAAIRGTSRVGGSEGCRDENGQPNVSERNHCDNALFARRFKPPCAMLLQSRRWTNLRVSGDNHAALVLLPTVTAITL
jgi:hypothetical protein